MNRETVSDPDSVRNLVAGAWGALCVLILAPPFLASHRADVAAAGIYFFFSCICHQSPERVFTIFDFPLAVCHRCCGIYLGFFLGALFRNSRLHRSAGARRKWILAAVCPLAFDALAPYCGLWTNTSWTRFATGLAFGIVASSLLVQGIAEFMAEAPWRRFAPGESPLRGGLS
jgi:uncharacterized membrane protein